MELGGHPAEGNLHVGPEMWGENSGWWAGGRTLHMYVVCWRCMHSGSAPKPVRAGGSPPGPGRPVRSG